MNKLFLLSLMTVSLLMVKPSFAQELLRSASFGALVADVNDSTRAALKLSSRSGTLIQRVVPNSSAAKAGFMINDVLISLDGQNIDNTNDFLQTLKKHHGGDEVKISF